MITLGDFNSFDGSTNSYENYYLRYSNVNYVANFSIGVEASPQYVRQYAPRSEPPDLHYYRRGEKAKVTVWIGICGNDLGP